MRHAGGVKMGHRVHDVSMPIFNGMWRYRSGWESCVSTLASTARGDASTVYRFDFCSHAGTYVETSQHKLNNDVLLDGFGVGEFVRECTVVVTATKRAGDVVTLAEVRGSLAAQQCEVVGGDALLIATGWGMEYRSADYLVGSPCFSRELVAWLCTLQLGLLGVDVPAIEDRRAPYGPVQMLFEAGPRTLLLAPLVIDTERIRTGRYILCAAPLKIETVCASLCRALLFELS